MRPAELAPLFAPLRCLKGVGPRLETMLEGLLKPQHRGAPTILDLLLHLPVAVVDRRRLPSIAAARSGELGTFRVRVSEHRPGGRTRSPYRVLVEDEAGALELVYFKADRAYLQKLLPLGTTRVVSGKLETYDGYLQMPHPDYVVADAAGLPEIEPVYPLTAGLSNAVIRRLMAAALARVPELPEWQDPAWMARHAWPSFAAALARLHAPQSAADVEPSAPARVRLAYDELLANQLAIAAVRRRIRRVSGRALAGDGVLRAKILAALPFALTQAQTHVLAEIDSDLASPHRMLRLLQGDVGSGKTIVALLAMAGVVEAGAQAALMAPTELLARQHHKTISDFGGPAGLRVRLLSGRERGKERAEILSALQTGEIDILVGTHAIFQESVGFRDLGLAVVDEQHRFGVHQRLALQAKGPARAAELLVMTATPIPRTLLLTNFGDMEVSRIVEKPPGRRAVETRIVPDERLAALVDSVARAVDGGAQVYWVCPLVAESELLDLAAAEERYAVLAERFSERVGLVHGRLAAPDKDAVMAAFAEGRLSILVATTVIEVGVDVPNASIMIIEHAERFGLAQLHQLRGRVGRGAKDSACILLYHKPLSTLARERLNVMRRTQDGFVIAEEDLRLRGGGELLGTRQSGLPVFRVARLPDDHGLLEAARDQAKLALARDADLKTQRSAALRLLLYLFERDDAIRLLRAG
jgi:ATP-dependent DNA helicase RecG